jgi:hypothetical protein
VSFRLLNQEQGQLNVARVSEFEEDGRYVQEIGVTQTGISQIGKIDPMLGHLHTQVPRKPSQFMIDRFDPDALAVHRLREAREMRLDLPGRLTEHVVFADRSELLVGML